ncbi:MAG: ribosomal subunit interface protein [Chlamydiae bacterium RIFCSPHIGHO2_12_FULL_49_11]|nr:MAG: ribosomal subunit interface protein [Chlamydiae bacterium RIFCSPHIGHO2_12_FULL_49_11]
MGNLDRQARKESGIISVYGKHLEITPAIEDYVKKKIEKLKEHTPPMIDTHVILEVQKGEHRAEILYKFSHFNVLAHSSSLDLYQSIDLALARLRRKLEKWKTKIQNHHHRGLEEIELSVNVLDRNTQELAEINDTIEETHFQEVEKELAPPQIMSKDSVRVPLLTLDEAAMKIELQGNSFLIYRSEEDQKLKVMYVRPDHYLGVLEIE